MERSDLFPSAEEVTKSWEINNTPEVAADNTLWAQPHFTLMLVFFLQLDLKLGFKVHFAHFHLFVLKEYCSYDAGR